MINWKRKTIILASIICGSMLLMMAVGVGLDKVVAAHGGRIGEAANFTVALVVAILMNIWAWLSSRSRRERPNIFFFGLTCYIPGELMWYGYKEYYNAPKDKVYGNVLVAFALIGWLWIVSVPVIVVVVGGHHLLKNIGGKAGSTVTYDAAPDVGLQDRIALNQAIIARDPGNLQAWIQLGNDFFETHQAQKAIEAYGRALDIKPNDPNVLSDQGVMYRMLGQFDKAIQNFEKANRVEPTHLKSLFNLGVVYAIDMKDPKKAIDAWNRVIQAAPQSEMAALANRAIEQVKGEKIAR